MKFEPSKLICASNKHKAEIGKHYYFYNDIYEFLIDIEYEFNTVLDEHKRVLKHINTHNKFHIFNSQSTKEEGGYIFIYPVENNK